MDILHVSPELAPFAKVGGLADVASALTKNLKLLGHRVTLAIPRYAQIATSGPMLARRLTPLSFELGGKKHEAVVFDAKLASGVELVVIDVPGLFDRAGIYGEDGADYPDNPERFATFSRAVVELVAQRARAGSPFAAVHAHDWPAALVPYFLKKQAERPRTVLTIHNLAHQGIVPRDRMAALGIEREDFHMGGVEFFGQANVLKAGIVSADAITTVSETYAADILGPQHGARLDGVLRSRKDVLTGIVNGVDSSVWNPATDTALVARYDVEDITNKARCKGALLAELGLEVAHGRPLAIFVGRLVPQKGADVLLAALPKILGVEATLAIAGDGDPALIEKLSAAAQKDPSHVAFVGAASEAQVHRMFAGADLVIVPSRFEPCGLVQLYGQRYGTVPVAHAVGGIRDTVIDCDAALETGSGFLFDEATPASLAGAMGRARAAYDSPRWRGLVRRVMRLDRGWERPTRRYEQIYRAPALPVVDQARRRLGDRASQPRCAEHDERHERELVEQEHEQRAPVRRDADVSDDHGDSGHDRDPGDGPQQPRGQQPDRGAGDQRERVEERRRRLDVGP